MAFYQVVVIYNPAAGTARRRPESVPAFCAALAAQGVAVEAKPTLGPHDAGRLAAEARSRGVDLVVAYGGDGTINEIMQPLVGTNTALAIWPGGTANVLAYDLRMPADPRAMAQRVLAGNRQRVTVGQARPLGGGAGRYFLAMAGLGLDAAVVRAVPSTMKRHLGKGAFVVSAAQQLFAWRPTPFALRWPGGEITATFAVLGNTRSYGGGLRMTPMADLSAPYLDLCAFQASTLAGYLPYPLTVPFGLQTRLRSVLYLPLTEVVAEPLGPGDIPLQLDGEEAGRLPVRLSAIPAALTILV